MKTLFFLLTLSLCVGMDTSKNLWTSDDENKTETETDSEADSSFQEDEKQSRRGQKRKTPPSVDLTTDDNIEPCKISPYDLLHALEEANTLQAMEDFKKTNLGQLFLMTTRKEIQTKKQQLEQRLKILLYANEEMQFLENYKIGEVESISLEEIKAVGHVPLQNTIEPVDLPSMITKLKNLKKSAEEMDDFQKNPWGQLFMRVKLEEISAAKFSISNAINKANSELSLLHSLLLYKKNDLLSQKADEVFKEVIKKNPERIVQLRKLKTINLENMGLEVIPPQIWRAYSDATSIHLNNKKGFTNPNRIKLIPEWVKNLKHLKELFLSQNNLEEIGKALAFTKLKKINLNNNLLQEVNFTWFPLTLRELHLNECGLSIIRENISYLRDLHVLDLGRNNIQELPPQMTDLSKLQTLNLNDNPLLQKDTLLNIPKSIKELNLACCGLDELPIKVVGILNNLKTINFSNNKISILVDEDGNYLPWIKTLLDTKGIKIFSEGIKPPS